MPEHRQLEMYSRAAVLSFADAAASELPLAEIAGVCRAFTALDAAIGAARARARGRILVAALPRAATPHGRREADGRTVPRAAAGLGRRVSIGRVTSSGRAAWSVSTGCRDLDADDEDHAGRTDAAAIRRDVLSRNARACRIRPPMSRRCCRSTTPTSSARSGCSPTRTRASISSAASCRSTVISGSIATIRKRGWWTMRCRSRSARPIATPQRFPIDFYVIHDGVLHIIPVEALTDGRLPLAQLADWRTPLARRRRPAGAVPLTLFPRPSLLAPMT